jgi:glycosyltransferase involved in cell wall biosynthesis
VTWETRGKEFGAAIADARRVSASCFDPPLRVVFVGHVAQRSGGELALLRVLPALRTLGIDPHVILGEDGPLVRDMHDLDVSVEVLPFDAAARNLRRGNVRAGRIPIRAVAQTASYIATLTHRLRALQPDLVHTNTLKAAYLGGVAARAATVPVVWHVRDRIADDYLPYGAVRMTRGLARVIPNAVIANSRATLDTLGDRRDLLARVPHVVVHDSVRPPVEPRARREAAFTVGILGRLSPWKGQHIFLEAFARAFPDGPERAMVIGAALFDEYDYEVRLHQLCARLGITDRVTFAGHRDDVYDALGELDVLVHASTVPEPFGQVVLEGMAVGLPVIATAAGGPAEIITHRRDGMLVASEDIDALRTTLQTLRDNPQLRRSLSEAAAERASDFHPDVAAKRIASVYRRITQQSPASRV